MVLQSPDYHFLSFAHLHQTVPPQLGVTGKFASEYFNKFVSCLMQFEDKIYQGPKRNNLFRTKLAQKMAKLPHLEQSEKKSGENKK